MKKTFTKKQILNEMAVEYDPQHRERMHPDIERKLSDKSHHLGGHPAFPPTTGGQSFEEKIASQRFKDVVNKVKRYSGSENINQQVLIDALSSLKTIIDIEKNHKEELNKIAVKLVKKEFGLKDQIDLIPDITDELDFSKMKVDEPEEEGGEEEGGEEYEAEDIEDLENAEDEIKKRRLVNALIQGAAKKGHYMFHLVEEDLNRIDPRLITLYGKIMSIGDFQYWMVSDEQIKQVIEQTKSGKVSTGVTGDNNDPRDEEEQEEQSQGRKKHYVHGEGLIFPVVVHELIKGVMEVMSLPSLPQNPKVREYVLNKTDFIQGENWDLRLGPGIWEKFLDAIDEDAWEVKHYLYQHIIKMAPQEFNSFMRELLAGTNKGKQELARLAADIKQSIVSHNYEKSEYEKKKAEKEKSYKEVEDDFMKQIKDLLKPRNDLDNL
jgi:hypothetical protein